MNSLLPPRTLGFVQASATELHMILKTLLLVLSTAVWAGQGLQSCVPVSLSLVVNESSFVLGTENTSTRPTL